MLVGNMGTYDILYILTLLPSSLLRTSKAKRSVLFDCYTLNPKPYEPPSEQLSSSWILEGIQGELWGFSLVEPSNIGIMEKKMETTVLS